jgi:hypothetical protein
MRRCLLVLMTALAVATAAGCSWYDALHQRFSQGRSDEPNIDRAEAEKLEAREPD